MRYFLDIPRIIDGSGAHPDAASPPVEGCGEHGGEESGEPRGARRGAPWGGEWGTPWGTVGSAVERGEEPRGTRWGARRGGLRSGPWGAPGADGGFCTIRSIATACRRRVASLLVQFPPRGGEHAGEESGEPSGARWGARWGGEWGTPWGTVESARGGTVGRPDHALTDSEAGARPRAPPPLGPATSQVSRRSSGRPSVVPDPE